MVSGADTISNGHGFSIRGDDLGVNPGTAGSHSAKAANGEHAAAAESGKGGALGADGERGRGMIERLDCGEYRSVACRVVGVEGMAGSAGLETESALAGGGAELGRVKAGVNIGGSVQAIKTGSGENKGVGMALVKLAEAGVDVAADLDEFKIGSEGQEHGTATRARGADAAMHGKGVQSPIWLADPDVARVGALRHSCEGEASVQRGRKVLKGVDGQVDLSGREGVLNLFDEDAAGVEGCPVKGSGRNKGWALHPVTGRSNHLNFDGVAVSAE